MKNVNQEGLNELSQQEKNDINGGDGLIGAAFKWLDDQIEEGCGKRPFQKFE